MKKLVKIIKWTFLIVAFLGIGVGAIVASRQNLTYNAIYPDIKASADPAIIERGRHLVFSSAHCIECHHKGNADSLAEAGREVPLTGGVSFSLPVGIIYSKNITPDKETGIGGFTDGEIARALRYGIHPDGTAVYDFMPFHNTSDEDLTAIISYLRSQKPVKNKVPKNQLNIIGNVVKAFLVKPVGPTEPVPGSVTRDTSVAYGRYLSLSVAECNGCHTKRDIAGKFTGKPFAGGNDFDGLVSPNITPDSSGRIFGWSKKIFIDRFRMGKLIPKSPMPWNCFKRMTDDELTAVYNYLQTLQPVKARYK
jgi:mono/diheme cytochrome c family protein